MGNYNWVIIWVNKNYYYLITIFIAEETKLRGNFGVFKLILLIYITQKVMTIVYNYYVIVFYTELLVIWLCNTLLLRYIMWSVIPPYVTQVMWSTAPCHVTYFLHCYTSHVIYCATYWCHYHWLSFFYYISKIWVTCRHSYLPLKNFMSHKIHEIKNRTRVSCGYIHKGFKINSIFIFLQ